MMVKFIKKSVHMPLLLLISSGGLMAQNADTGVVGLDSLSTEITSINYLTVPLHDTIRYLPPLYFVSRYSDEMISDTFGGGYEPKVVLSNNTMTLTPSCVGIGTKTPHHPLHVEGDVLLSGRLSVGAASTNYFGNSNLNLLISNDWTFTGDSVGKIIGNNCRFFTYKGTYETRRLAPGAASALILGNDGSVQMLTSQPNASIIGEIAWNRMILKNDGSVGIGTSSTEGYKLAVNGKIHCTEVVVTATVPVPDYVFEEDYPLLPLPEVSSYIRANRHLPELPSAAEAKADGIQLSEMNTLLLKKVEELTLYLIQQEEKITGMQRQLDELKRQ